MSTFILTKICTILIFQLLLPCRKEPTLTTPLQQYEHHTALRRDPLCPFKLHRSVALNNTICNWHKNIEILLVTDGSGWVQYDAVELPVENGDIVIVNSGALHRPHSETGISFYCLIIDDSFCRENGLGAEKRRFCPILRDAATEELFRSAANAISKYQLEGTAISAAKARGAVLSLLINICENHSDNSLDGEESAKRSERYVKRALEYLGEHYAEPIRLESLAGMLGITKFHLSREFKRYTGQTVFTYINTVRCKNAELCIANGLSVTEAAYGCGFESLSYFSRTYKRLMGKPPSSKNTKPKPISNK